MIFFRSVIRTYNLKEYVAVPTEGINSCNEYRSFWITWQNGAIEVGRGEVIGTDRFMDFQPLDLYPVNAVGFSSGYGLNGTWNIKLLQGSYNFTKAQSMRSSLNSCSFVELLPTEPPATEDPGPDNGDKTSGGLDGGAIAGIVLGVLLAAVLVILLVGIFMRGPPSLPAGLPCMSSGTDEAAPIAPDNNAPEQVTVDAESNNQSKDANDSEA